MAQPIYQQDFNSVADADGWFEIIQRGDIRDPLQHVADNDGQVVSGGNWWPDPNHINPGAGWLNLPLMRDATDLPIHEFTDLIFNFTIDLDGINLPDGARIYAFFQSQDPNISWGSGNFVNYLNIANPITGSGSYSVHFSTDPTDWLALGSSLAREDTYSISASIADALAGTPLDFGLVILRGDATPQVPLSGSIALDDISLERAGAYRAWVDSTRPFDLQPLGLALDLVDTPNTFDGLTLTLTDTTGANAIIGFTASLVGSLTLSGLDLIIDNTVIGAVSGGLGGVPFTIRFIDGVTAEMVETALSALAFAPGSEAVSNLSLRIVDDGGTAMAMDIAVRSRTPYYNGSGDDHFIGAAGNDALRGGSGSDWLEGLAGDDQLSGGDGNDRLDGGDGNDLLQGGDGDDILLGGDGADLLIGGSGANLLIGGRGDDAFYIDDARDVVEELAGEGNDRVFAYVSYALSAQAHVETLSAYDTSTSDAIDLTGNDFDNLVLGNAGINRLDGAGGNDTIYGLAGDDILIGGGGDDTLVGGDGADHAEGGEGNDTLVGDAGDDILIGGDGNDTLVGGTGADIMIGGVGDDHFYVDDARDVIVELDGEGTDRVYATVSYVLGANARVETMSAYDNAAANAIDLTGNGFDNLILGNAGVNRLDGGGGDDILYGFAGDDTLIGGTGDDILVGDDGNDLLQGGDGTDQLIGGTGSDTLVGGVGADILIGGAGDDFLYVDNAGDVVVELAGEGNDRVYTTVSYVLSAAASVETLSVYDTGSNYAIDLTGNGFANLILGNAGANRIDGDAGDDILYGLAGDDLLLGGSGNDTLVGGDGDDRLEGGNGNDTLLGDAGYDTLIGGAGSDTLVGGAGADILIGGAGDDFLYVDDAGDVIVERAGEGNDRVYATVSYALAADAAIETLSTYSTTGTDAIDLTGNGFDNLILGNAGINRIEGGGGNDTLYGFAGNDILIGGAGSDTLVGGEGADSMIGGAGNDYYYVDDADDVIEEIEGEGNDRVYATASYALGGLAHIETLSAYDSLTTYALDLTGNGFDNLILGNAGTNRLEGGAGNDTLYAFAGDDILIGGEGNDTLVGGIGADVMIGGTGDDNYYVDDAGDVVIEAEDEGRDRVYTTVSYALAADAHIETLSAYDTAGGYAIDLTGNRFDNLILGSAAANRLDGGDGNDTLYGFAGDDILIGGQGDDALVGGDGNDRIEGGAGNDTLLGDGGSDTLIGGAGNDTLVGGAGADILIGGAGDDYLYVDNAGDVIVELEGEGNDRVYTTVSYALGADVAVETLNVYDAASSYAIDLTGNRFANLILGNAGANRLDGGDGNDTLYGFAGNDVLIGGGGDDILYGDAGDDRLEGGAGNDRLTGGAGADLFVFATPLGPSNVDTIVDFTRGVDKIALDTGIFASLGLGALGTGVLQPLGSLVQGSAPRILYDAAAGGLYFDGDGALPLLDPILFAKVTPGLVLAASDFILI